MPEQTLKDCDKAFKKSTFRQYWIINKKQVSTFDESRSAYSNVYGPFKKEKYLEKMQELNVPKRLTLN